MDVNLEKFSIPISQLLGIKDKKEFASLISGDSKGYEKLNDLQKTGLSVCRLLFVLLKTTNESSSLSNNISAHINDNTSENNLDKSLKNVIVIANEMDKDLIDTAPSALSGAATGLGYSNDLSSALSLAQYIINLGYKAVASQNDTALSIPLAIEAGLGEYARNGLLITKKFGPPENFAIYLMAFVVIGSVVSDSIIKGIISTLFGAVIALIGEDTITGQFKMTMGIDELESGMALVPLLIGVFVISEVIIQAEKAAKVKMIDLDKSKLDDPTAHYFTWPEFKRCFPLMFRSSIYGSLIGMMPGLGSSVACFVAYGEEKRKAKNKDKWGTGVVEGIAAPESANNAVSGPSMIPLLTLGIPGSTIAAVLIGMFLVNGLQVGPQIFATEPPLFVAGRMMSPREFIFGIFAAGLVGIACYAIIGYFAAPLIGRAIAILPTQYLYPFIFMISLAASYSSRASIWDVGFAILFGIIGYGMRRTNFSAAAFIIAFVLTSSMEEAFRQSMIISDNGIWLFFSFEYQNKFSYAPIFLLIGAAVVIIRAVSSMSKNKNVTPK